MNLLKVVQVESRHITVSLKSLREFSGPDRYCPPDQDENLVGYELIISDNERLKPLVSTTALILDPDRKRAIEIFNAAVEKTETALKDDFFIPRTVMRLVYRQECEGSFRNPKYDLDDRDVQNLVMKILD